MTPAGTRSLWHLLHPGKRALVLTLGVALGMAVWGFAVYRAGMPVWGATFLFLAVVFVPAAAKWRDDLARWGAAATLLGVLVVLQGFHMLEHVVQMVQYYLFDLPPARSQGLISAANVEWVHFVWNWGVWGVVVYLMRRGWRNAWAWSLLAWTTAHSLEHAYLLFRYFRVVAELHALGLPLFDSAQGLPGILGRNGWLAYSSLCGWVPGLTTAPRVAIHFWWNLGELALLLLAAARGLPSLLAPTVAGGTALWSRGDST